MRKESVWEEKHNPELIINIKYVPYAALRQQLWRCLLNQYDAGDSGRLTKVELGAMLESLSSTLSEQTINGFFQRFQEPHQTHVKEVEEITIDQAVICLEDQLLLQSKSPASQDVHHSGSIASGSAAPSIVDLPEKDASPSNPSELGISTPDSESNGGSNGNGLADSDDKAEYVIRFTECPLCHRPRLNKRSEVDIVTHLATSASRDWRQVDHFVMGGFVTSDQAHRKWYTKVIPFPSTLMWTDHFKDYLWRI